MSGIALPEAHIARLDELLAQGSAAYPKIQHLLSVYLGLDEVAEVERRTRRRLLVWKSTLIGSALLVVLVNAALTDARGSAAVELIGALAPLLLTLPLVTWLQIPRVGVSLFMVYALQPAFGVFAPGLLATDAQASLVAGFDFLLVSKLAFAAAFGGCVQYGADADPRRDDRVARRWVLAAVLGGAAYVTWRQRVALGIGADAVAVGLAVLALLWPSIVVDKAEQARRRVRPDCRELERLAMNRWSRLVGGRVIAVCALAMVVLTFLNSFSMADQLGSLVAAPRSVASAATDAGAAPVATDPPLYWPRKKRLLVGQDLRQRRAYLTELARVDEDTRSKLVEEGPFALGIHRLGSAQCDELEPRIGHASIDGAEALMRSLRQAAAAPNAYAVFLVEPVTSAEGGKRLGCVIERIDASLTPLSGAALEQRRRTELITLACVGGLSLIGFAIMWRRAGESRAAMGLGVWYAGSAALIALPHMWLTFPAVFELASAGELTPARLFGATLVQTLQYLAFLLSVAAFVGMTAITALDSWFQSHVGLRETRWRLGFINFKAGQWLSHLAVLGSLILTALCGLAATRIGKEAATAAVILAHVVLGALLYGLMTRVAAKVDPGNAAWRLSGWLLVTQLCAALTVVFATGLNNGLIPTTSAGLALVGASLLATLVAAAVLLFRRNFLNVSGGQQVTFVATAFLIPITFEFVNNAVQGLVRDYGISETGAVILSGVFSLIVLQGFQKRLAQGLERLSFFRAPQVRDALNDLIERVARREDPAQIEHASREIFGRLGIRSYATYERTGATEFVRGIAMGEDAPRTLDLSEALQAQLLRETTFLDLKAVPFEWTYVFRQFEVHEAIELRTTMRYVMPLRVGQSLCGLFFLGDGADVSPIKQEWFARAVRGWGLVRAQRRDSISG